MIKTRTWVIIIILILIVCAALTVWLSVRKAEGTIANIYKDGECIRSVDLSSVTEPEIYIVSDEYGSNTILIENGRICVSEADCPDKVCVESGWLTDSASPIVCLPHRLVIRLEKNPETQDENSIDSVAR